jgi:leucyl-tRNA synthetase
MNQLPDTIRAALAPFAPAASSVQFTEAELSAADRAQERWKDGFHQRNEAKALALQIKANPQQWGIA